MLQLPSRLMTEIIIVNAYSLPYAQYNCFEGGPLGILHLAAGDGRNWISWIEPVRGFSYVAIPQHAITSASAVIYVLL